MSTARVLSREQMTEDEKKEQSFKTVLERVRRLRMRELFEEPCPLYEDDERE